MKLEFRQFVSKITVFESTDRVVQHCRQYLEEGKRLNIAFLNAHAFNLACRNSGFVDSIMASDLVLRDGIGVKILFKMLGKEPGYNLNGTDLIPVLLTQVYQGKKVALFGSTNKELTVARQKLETQNVQIVTVLDGFKEPGAYVQHLADHEVDLVVMAMGMPKQEAVSKMICETYPNISTINGGAIVDFIAGKVERAPEWVQKLSLEWAYRLMREPKRLFNRYVIGNVTFLTRAMIVKLSG
ncbi:WecB/TagA/CpsF family glycosyltransferase [Vibrio nigripulchritudo]|uniref:WecB/TagA/CpsF family glycosyltransferase n=1 Tax=Vibrio nigripulchritudo TaxID=28173 RepID=UPI0003B1D0AB|nr:WecB/TagA/CpsF family glycosyltransferase [Vibrio nigripulchritudo]CCN69935.1 putative Teichoic acid biosynthesis protein [Vibrio nigripulchritudo SFn118]